MILAYIKRILHWERDEPPAAATAPIGERSESVGTAAEPEAGKRLWQSQRLEILGQFCAGIVHDFSNLMIVVTGYADLVQRSLGEAHPACRDLGEIIKAGHRAGVLSRRLLAFTRTQPLQPQVVDLNSLIADLATMLRRLIGEQIELLVLPGSGSVCVDADAVQLEQVVINLLVNARDAMPAGGRVTIETNVIHIDKDRSGEMGDVTPGPYVSIVVRDTGCGMSAEVMPRIFQPFFTTKEPGKGTGLGLSTVHDIVRQNRGTIQVDSKLGCGTMFRVLLPQATHSAIPQSSQGKPQRTAGSENVLLVEDDEALRGFLRCLLQSNGYTVLEANNGRRAEAVLLEHKEPVHLLITDVIMPGLLGPELAQTLVTRRPHLKVLLMTGYPDCLITTPGVFRTGVAFMQKPFASDDFLNCVRGLLDGPLAQSQVDDAINGVADAA